MELQGKVAVVTGAASGIGRALAQRFAAEGARAVICADLEEVGARATAAGIGGVAFRVDVSREDEIAGLIETVERDVGPIDLFCSNAGIGVGGGAEASNADWQRIWDINVMAHVWAARHLVPRMVARGGGYLLNTASAAGLLSQIGSAVYSTTKHAALGFAESLAITHRDHGIKVSVLCPQAVDTAMAATGNFLGADVDGVLSPDDVAEAAVRGLEAEQFLILPHPSVRAYMAHKVENYDRWIGGMAKLRRSYVGRA